MTAAYILTTLVATPFFASRAFLATFLVALAGRFGPSVPVVGDSPAVAVLAEAPDWFVHPATLTVLGLLAALEFAATKSTAAAELLDQVDPVVKTATQLGVGLLLIPQAGELLPQAGLSPALLWPLVLAGIVAGLATLRLSVLRAISVLDEGDVLQLRRWLAWAEDGWVVAGVAVSAFLPVLALALFVVSVLGLAVLDRFFRWLDRRKHVPCVTCGHLLHPTAPHCANCGAARAPTRVGVFGQTTERPVDDPGRHRLELVRRGRCPHCGERLTRRSPSQTCIACTTVTFARPEDLDAYLGHLDRQLPTTLGVTFACAFVPVLGVVPAVVFAQLFLVSGAVRFVPPTRGVLLTWGLRLATVLVVMLQPVPVIGWFTLPLVAGARYFVARRALAGLRAKVGRAHA